jgi:hypothetical protein
VFTLFSISSTYIYIYIYIYIYYPLTIAPQQENYRYTLPERSICELDEVKFSAQLKSSAHLKCSAPVHATDQVTSIVMGS